VSYRSSVLLLLATWLSFSAFAVEKEQPLPKDLPPYGPLRPISAPHASEKKLSNGVTVWLVPRPGFPKVALALAVRGGMAADSTDRPGISELLVATLVEGTKTQTARQIAEAIEAAGGDLAGTASADELLIATNVLASKTGIALRLLADISQNATFPDSEIELAKRNAADALRTREAEPAFLADRALARAVFGEHPYSIISPTQESISKTSPAELKREYARRFRPDQALLVAVGDFDPQELTAEVEDLFGKWTLPNEAPVASVGQPSPPISHGVFFVERAGSVQTTFALGTLGPTERDTDYIATEVSIALYGGMFGSRLIKNIREDKGYTYSPYAVVETSREAGLLRTEADVRNEVTGASFNEISYEMNRMATTAPGADELARAERYLVGSRAMSLQSAASVVRRFARLWVCGLSPEELGRESEEISTVSATDVEKAGKKYFPASRQVIVAVGEGEVIKDQLAPFGLEVQVVP
jgi:zinc protease